MKFKVNTIFKPKEINVFFKFRIDSNRDIIIFLLEHHPASDDFFLDRLFPWTLEDLHSMRFYNNQQSKTTWCFSQFLQRHALSAAMGCQLAELRILKGKYGKPFLENSPLTFNLSHCSGCSALAVSRNRSLGIDIEDSKSISKDGLLLVSRNFSQSENRWINNGTCEKQIRLRSLSVFTQKEALLKALDIGLTTHLDSIKTSLADPPFITDSNFSFCFGENDDFVGSLSSGDLTSLGIEVRYFYYC